MHTVFRALPFLAGFLVAATAVAPRAHATVQLQEHLADRYEVALQRAVNTESSVPRPIELSEQDLSAFSGVGLIACTVESGIQTSTAFLVGAFDIGVTVAHTFEDGRHQVAPTDCVYTSIDSQGQIRERIPVAYVRSQWDTETGAFGQPLKDVAVFRLSQPSRYAQKTMPLGRFTGAAAPVVMVGYRAGQRSSVKLAAWRTSAAAKANRRAAPASPTTWIRAVSRPARRSSTSAPV